MKNIIVFTSGEEIATISDFLISAGYDISVYSDLDNCIEAIYCWDCAGLLVDISDQTHHVSTCLSLCDNIKKSNPQFPIILLIPQASVSVAVRAAKIGMQHIFEKPLGKKTMTAILNEILPQAKTKHIPLSERLTAQEKKIVTHILKGHTNKEIAKLLDRSIRTVEEHRASIMRKLGVDNTVDLLNSSLQVGIVDPEDISHPR